MRGVSVIGAGSNWFRASSWLGEMPQIMTVPPWDRVCFTRSGEPDGREFAASMKRRAIFDEAGSGLSEDWAGLDEDWPALDVAESRLSEDSAELGEVWVALNEVCEGLEGIREGPDEAAATGGKADGAGPEASRIAPKRGQVLYRGSEGS